jgi:hypothetical protein
LKALKILLLWILALQILNMSMYSESYWFYFNGDQSYNGADRSVDPTETIVEWLVELKSGQQDAFTYSQNNTDSKSLVKTLHFEVNLKNLKDKYQAISENKKIVFQNFVSKLVSTSLEILSPPPDFEFSSVTI